MNQNENLKNEVQETKNEFTPKQPEQKSKKKLTLIIISIVVFVIASGFGVFFFVYKKAEDYKNEQLKLTAEERQVAINSLFSVSEYDAIPEKYKEYIYDFMAYNNYLDGTYFFTKISDRAKNVFAFGDFTSDDNEEDDLAIIIESNDFSSSRLVIFNHKGELLYIEDYSNELPVINSYKVGSKIYMDELKLVPSPCDGLIVKTEYNKRAVVYDKKDKKFKTYYQYTKEEIDAMNSEESNYEEDYIDEASETEVTTQVPDESTFSIQVVE